MWVESRPFIPHQKAPRLGCFFGRWKNCWWIKFTTSSYRSISHIIAPCVIHFKWSGEWIRITCITFWFFSLHVVWKSQHMGQPATVAMSYNLTPSDSFSHSLLVPTQKTAETNDLHFRLPLPSLSLNITKYVTPSVICRLLCEISRSEAARTGGQRYHYLRSKNNVTWRT